MGHREENGTCIVGSESFCFAMSSHEIVHTVVGRELGIVLVRERGNVLVISIPVAPQVPLWLKKQRLSALSVRGT